MLKDQLIALIGEWLPAGSNGLASIDYEWCAAAAILALSIYCCFRLIGGLINRV